jgi:hypothetical protein
MTWECAECNGRETDNSTIKINAVCHHCGKPLCQKDRIQIIDEAFSADDGLAGRFAVHCKPCRRLHHPKLAKLTEPDEE